MKIINLKKFGGGNIEILVNGQHKMNVRYNWEGKYASQWTIEHVDGRVIEEFDTKKDAANNAKARV